MTRTEPLAAWLAQTQRWAEDQLQRFMPVADAHPERLHRAMHYVLFGGDKRLRPALVRLMGQLLGGASPETDERCARPAAAIELIHTYSLVHDDLPCMDDDDLRRGRATCHVAFDEATAVLTGDALLTLAFEVLTSEDNQPAPPVAPLVRLLAEAAGAAGMVGGQVLDLSLERGATLDLATLRDMHGRKTAALFRASAEMGAIAVGADARQRALAREFGEALGLAFQAVDDHLDATGDAHTLGKTPGKDETLERPTMVAVLGLEGARRRADELARGARAALESLAPGDDALAQELVDFVLRRRA